MLDNDDFITLSFLCYQGIETAAVDTFVVIRYSVVFDHLHIFKKLENTEIWEFRTLYNGICYRLFSFWDTEEETWVIATHGIVSIIHLEYLLLVDYQYYTLKTVEK